MNTIVGVILSWAARDSKVNSTRDILSWIEERNRTVEVQIKQADFSNEDFWYYNEEKGAIVNRNESFFSITGLHITTEEGTSLEQPVIIQDEIGYLGILCKKIDGILHFLMQAKIEPGNINKIQLSPTIQATKSNFTQRHGGKQPPYLEYFLNARKNHIVVDQIQSEQSSRFYKKRNRNIIVEVVEGEEVPILPSHKWMTLGQIKELMTRDNLVNMDTRTVLSCIPYSVECLSKEEEEEIYTCFTDKALYNSIFSKSDNKLPSIFHELNNYKMFSKSKAELIPLASLAGWIMSPSRIYCQKGYHFDVIYCDIAIEGREVKQWRQPLFRAIGKATFGLFTCVQNDVRKFLVCAKPEVGCFDGIELGPTIQLEPDYDSKNLDAVEQLFQTKLSSKEGIVKNVILSEEGGRFYHEENYNVIINIENEEIGQLPEGYFWTDYATLNELVQVNNCLNIQLRNLLSLIDL